MIDELQNDKIQDLESRVRLVEQAVVELGVMSKYLKYGVLVVATSLGVDVGGMI